VKSVTAYNNYRYTLTPTNRALLVCWENQDYASKASNEHSYGDEELQSETEERSQEVSSFAEAMIDS
jgi:hypothetical protein